MSPFPSDSKTPLQPPPSYTNNKSNPNAQSELPSSSSSSSTPRPQFATLHLAQTDRVRLIGFPPDVIPAVNGAIVRVWITGIQRQGQFDTVSWEWKLSGRPWSGQGHEAIPSRRLIIHILHALALLGWHLYTSVDLSKKGWDKDSLIFKSGPPVQRYFFAVTFNEQDKVRIVDCPNQAVMGAFTSAIQSSWPLGIQQSKEKEPACHQIKLKGNPWWTSDGHEINHGRLMVCALLAAMEGCGFELVGSVDMSVAGGNNNVGDLDTWFFANKLS